MKNNEIKSATAQYTGGNIYIYYGELENGLYFRAGDCEEFIEICNADTSTDEADYIEFYDEHRKETLTGEEYKTFWNAMLLWIIRNGPKGNYNTGELESRIIAETEKDALKLKNDGYVYISEKGIEYELLEGFSVGVEKRYTSDIIFIVLLNTEYNTNENVAGFVCGANCFASDPNSYKEIIREYVREFEEKHFKN